MYYTDQTIVYLNGSFSTVREVSCSPFTQTLHYGNGVFEGIRAYNTSGGARIFKPVEHFKRLQYSAKTMRLSLDYTTQEMIEATYQVLERNNLREAYIRPLVFADENMGLTVSGKALLFIAAWEWAKYLGDKLLRVGVSSYEGPNPKAFHIDAKISGHYVNSILATMEAKQNGFDEALILDSDGFVAQGSGANVFFEKDGTLFTPVKGHILPGITRQTVLDLAKELGVKVTEVNCSLDDLKAADSAFFTGTAVEIAGIGSIDDQLFPMPFEQSIGYKLSSMYKDLVRVANPTVASVA